jgi:hypothetical protein
MGSNKYADELEKERELVEKANPFTARKLKPVENDINAPVKKSVPFMAKRDKDSNYFHMILGSDFEDLEMEIRGLRYYKDIDERTGKETLIMRRIDNHYLSEVGADDLILELKAHLSSDIKLGRLSRKEFLMQMEIIRKFLVSYVTNNLYKLGMDTEQKQRKSPTLLVMMLSRIRSVYSRSIGGQENNLSHGDMKFSGELDYGQNDKFKMEDMKN